jgi:hypothetical protein
MVLVAEEPGVGLGARFAGLANSDPGDLGGSTPHNKVEAAGHPAPLWTVPGVADRAAFVGEARGMWLWLVLWPTEAGVLLVGDVALADARDFGPAAYEFLGYGALSPRMTAAPVAA